MLCGECERGRTVALGTSACVVESECGRRWQDVAFWPATLVAVMLPYSITFLIAWTIFLVLYFWIGFPLGLQSSYTYP